MQIIEVVEARHPRDTRPRYVVLARDAKGRSTRIADIDHEPWFWAKMSHNTENKQHWMQDARTKRLYYCDTLDECITLAHALAAVSI